MMLAWRCVIIAVSCVQLAAGVACWYFADDPDIGRFGLAVCLAVGGLGLVGQGTTFLRPAAIGANVVLGAVFVPGFLGRVVIRIMECVAPGSLPEGIDTGFATDLFATGMVFGAAASARGLWHPGAAGGGSTAEPDAAQADGGRDVGSS
jgi:hypothetical protein